MRTTRITLAWTLEPFSFVDGVRLAWVRWELGNGERHCIGVREIGGC
jgi:hypothetical protein